MRQGGQRVDPRMGRILAELNNRFADIVVAGDDDVGELLMSIENNAADALITKDDAVLRKRLLDIAVGSIVLIMSIDHKAELEFHRQRQMFYIIGDLLNVGVLGDERSHRQWMADEGDEDSYNEAIRGYVDKTGVYAYKGHDFTLSLAAEADFGSHFPALVEQMNIDAELPVWAGVVPGPQGIQWAGRKKLGTVAALMGWA